MKKLIEKLIEKRNAEQPVKNDYTALYKLLFGEQIGGAVNSGAELEAEMDRTLAELEPFARYCVEERYLHGRSTEQLAEDIRGTLDMNEFAAEYLEAMDETLREMFMTAVAEVFRKMQNNNFNALKYLGEQCGFFPLPDEFGDEYYEKRAFKSAADILRVAIEKYEKDGKRFEDAYTDAEFAELRRLFEEEMEDIFDGIKDNDFYETRFRNENINFIPQSPDHHYEPAAFISIAEMLSDCIEEFYDGFYGNSRIFDGYYMFGKTEKEIADWLSCSFEVFVNELCERASGAFRHAALDEDLEEPQ